MSSKSKKIEKGCVGFFYNGIISKGKVVLGFDKNSCPEDLYKTRLCWYGNGLMFKYVSCTNPEEIFEKFQNDMKNTLINDNVYSGHIDSTEKALKEASGEKVAHLFPKRSNKPVEEIEKDEPEKDIKPTKKDKVESEDEETLKRVIQEYIKHLEYYISQHPDHWRYWTRIEVEEFRNGIPVIRLVPGIDE